MDALSERISPIGFGAFKIGRNQGIKYGQGYELPDDAAVERLLNGVLDLGVTYIDTAPAYGLSEERVGRLLARRRNDIVLSTKVGERFEGGISTYDFSKTAMERSIAQSLEDLGTDFVDILFLHAPRNDFETLTSTEAVRVLVEAKRIGLARCIGFSGYTAEAFRHAMGWADALMLEYHPENREHEPIINEAARRGLMVMVKKGLSSGRVAAKEGIEFALGSPGVTSLVIGSLSIQHMAENVQLARGVRGPAVSH